MSPQGLAAGDEVTRGRRRKKKKEEEKEEEEEEEAGTGLPAPPPSQKGTVLFVYFCTQVRRLSMIALSPLLSRLFIDYCICK